MTKSSIKIYGISGLGADHRAYQKLNLNYEFIPIKWETPIPNETLKEYSKRLAHQIDQSEPFILMGVSFGGLVSMEINKEIKPVLTILISSAASHKELPRLYRVIGKMRIVEVLPKILFKSPIWIMYWLFSAKNKKLLKEILNDTDPYFVKWAVKNLLTWRNSDGGREIIKIHGTSDRLIPMNNKKCIQVLKGGHFMIVDRAEEISEIINREIKKTLGNKV